MFHVKQSQMKEIEICPVCKCRSYKNYLATNDFFFTNETFNLVECTECQFVFTNPVPSDPGRYYDTEEYLSHTAEKQDFLTRIYKVVRKINIQKKYKLVDINTDGKDILDIGCGTGELLNHFKKKGWETLGIEPNKSARQFANEKHNLIVKDVEYLNSLKDKSYDAITMWHVLEHVPDLNERMVEIRRICKDDGTMFIALPNLNSPDSRHYGKFWAGLDVPRHLYHFTKETFSKLAKNHKLEVVSEIPMKFDAYYVSMLSEKYMNTSMGKLRAIIQGFKSNAKAKRTNNYSSMIFVLKKFTE